MSFTVSVILVVLITVVTIIGFFALMKDIDEEMKKPLFTIKFRFEPVADDEDESEEPERKNSRKSKK